MKETLKSKNFLPVIFCLCICFIGLLSGCGEKVGNESADLRKNRYVKGGTEKSEEAKEKDKSGKLSYPSILNDRLMEMYEPIWKEYEYVQYYRAYHEEIWEKIRMDTYPIKLASAIGEKDILYYSFMDVNGDGVVEMLIGHSHDAERISFLKEWGYPSSDLQGIQLFTVYYYYFPQGYVTYGYVRDRIQINLYEGGILEYFYSEILYDNYVYYTLRKGEWEKVDELAIRGEHKIPEDAPKNVDPVYMRIQERNGKEENEYITEEEFYAIQQEYTNTPLQIEWKSFADTEKIKE